MIGVLPTRRRREPDRAAASSAVAYADTCEVIGDELGDDQTTATEDEVCEVALVNTDENIGEVFCAADIP